ncbi:Panacea domain-containing protein [Pseudomonas sp. MAFF 302030]|uniref:Panacea domain-containing protein n=1 Tax=Pseudomonas morbosilactucae TaxID=2938197 RepID=A0A9X1YSL9_9PSED|nr:Panacea domain-containing protein [Pseudomonas morbosilactucae]MCK9797448.1 Panacea domain-containing protein [Pseudomonas morbosilactucae]
MTNKLLNIIKYILTNYPYPDELSASRLTKMVYLADWKEAISNGRQISNIAWFFNHHGPYNDEILQEAKKDKNISITIKSNMFGGKKTHIELHDKGQAIDIDAESSQILDFVINATKDKNYTDFIKLVYSTYPVISSGKYSELDLVRKAEEYKKLS